MRDTHASLLKSQLEERYSQKSVMTSWEASRRGIYLFTILKDNGILIKITLAKRYQVYRNDGLGPYIFRKINRMVAKYPES